MTHLAHLSTELLDAILPLLQRTDLVQLARSCKKLRDNVTPFLYSKITWTWSGGPPGPCVPPQSPPIRLLLRSILANPDLAKLIKELDLQAEYFRVRQQRPKSPADGPAPDRTTIVRVREAMSWAPNRTAWSEAVCIGNVGAMIAFLLTRLPELRSLSLGPDLQQSNAYLGPVFLHMSTKSNNGVKWHRLRHVNLGTSIEGNDHRHWSIGLPFDQFTPFFYLSSLESAVMMFPGFVDRPNRADGELTTLPWPLPIPRTPALTVLRLKRTHADPRVLWSLTAIAPKLKILEYDYWLHYYLSLDTEELRKALSPVKHTLERLTISFEPFSSEAADPGEEGDRIISGALSCLKDFHNLRSLEISIIVLLGWYVRSAKGLDEVLPTSIQTVTLRDDCVSFDDWEWDEEETMGAVTSFLTKDWQSTTPHLRSLNVRLSAGWRDTESLSKLCRTQGIDGEVRT